MTENNSKYTPAMAIRQAVDTIKTAILQSQARAAQAVNEEQLALYFGIGRYVSANSRKGYWGTGAIDNISRQLRLELPGLRGFSSRSLKNMRTFFEEWRMIEHNNSAVATAEITKINKTPSVTTDELEDTSANSAVTTDELPKGDEIRQLQLANLPDF